MFWQAHRASPSQAQGRAPLLDSR